MDVDAILRALLYLLCIQIKDLEAENQCVDGDNVLASMCLQHSRKETCSMQGEA